VTQSSMHNASPRYLGVRYAESERPFTSYPDQLAAYLRERFLGNPKDQVLVDLGCGRGEFLHAFCELGFRGIGIDRERVSTSFEEEILLCDLEREALPLEANSVDIIFNKSVLEHVREITPLLRECSRILRPGGLMVSLVPDFRAQWSHFYDDWTHVRPFTLTGLSECLQSHEFELLEAERFRQLPLLWQKPYLSPLADAAALLPSRFKRSKWVRFSKEWMLLAVARKPL